MVTGELMSNSSFLQSSLKVPCMVVVRRSASVRTRSQAEAVELRAVRKRRAVESCIFVWFGG